MRVALVCLGIAVALALAGPPVAVANHGGGKHFISKKRAKAEIRDLVRDNVRNHGLRVTNMRLDYCRYGFTATWERPRWLCDLMFETNRRRTYCGYGRVVKRGSPYTVEYKTSPYDC